MTKPITYLIRMLFFLGATAALGTYLLHVLRRTGGKRGMAAICIGGGLGGAMLVDIDRVIQRNQVVLSRD